MGSTKQNCDIYVAEVEYDTAVNKYELDCQKDLLNAAVKGDCEKVEQLLKFGICADAKEYNKLLFYASKNYYTPLQFATMHGHDKCVQLLIDYGADVNAKDLFGLTALHIAAWNGAYSILKILLHAKADCSVSIKFSYCGSLKYSANIGPCKIPHLGGTTPLHLAASINNADCVKELIRYGADFNAVDEHGRTSLFVAAQLGYSECVLIHLREAVGRDILSLPSLKTSDTPLHFAVKYHMFDCIKELLYLGSDVNHRNFNGLSPLHTALIPSNLSMPDVMQVLKLLVLEGYRTDINQPDWEGFVPLHYVCFNGHLNKWSRRPEIAKFLIAYGADVNINDTRKCSLLHHELNYPEENFDILKHMIKSMLHLPSLKSLNITCRPEPERVRLIRNQTERVQLIRNPTADYQNNSDLVEFFHGRPEMDQGRMLQVPDNLPVGVNIGMLRLIAGYHGQLGNAFDEDDDDDLDVDGGELHDVNNDNVGANQYIIENDGNDAASLVLKKQLWYEEMASKPRTLQHQCRFTIRKVLGPMKLKYILKLPIPSILQSYLLFELKG